jgi:hypothetical protein
MVCQPLLDALTEEDMKIFNKIFKNNNCERVEKFFDHKLIEVLWPTILKNMTFENCFGKKGPNHKISLTYKYIQNKLQEIGYTKQIT